MSLTVAEIADKVGGTLEGDGSPSIAGMASLQEARQGDVTFLANPRYGSAVAATGASAVIVNRQWTGSCPCAIIRVANPDKAFAQLACIGS